MGKHTPQPWYVNGVCIESRSGQLPVAMLGLSGKERDANASLISAAPDLLVQIERLLSLWEEAIGWHEDYMDMADPAREAIAKAKGEGT